MEDTSLLLITGVVLGLGTAWILAVWLIRNVREYLLERAKSKPERQPPR